MNLFKTENVTLKKAKSGVDAKNIEVNFLNLFTRCGMR